MQVSDCAKQAIEHVRDKSSGGPIAGDSWVTINFHPDVLHGDGIMIEALARDRVYRSQHETGISNGALAVGHDAGRHAWEKRMFGGAYDLADPASRPKYGALSRDHMIVGGSPRFGSAHLRLNRGILHRTTFCYPDSHQDPQLFGVIDRMGFLEHIQPLSDPLDNYVEAQIHGEIITPRDVSAIVLDPSFRDTAVEDAANRLDCPVEWHPGFSTFVNVSDFAAYRGQHIAELAASLFGEVPLTPALIAEARMARRADATDLKRIWHCLARFGSPTSLE